jgi:malonyl-CoA/methylmalonyl-CoA synthetase
MLKFMKTKTLINKKMVRYCQSMKLDLLVSISSVERASNIAVMDDMKNWSYKELDVYSGFLAGTIRDKIPKDCKTIAGFNGSNVYYVLSMITCWKLGMRFLPLCPTHPRHELEYFLKDSDSGMILYSPVNSSLTNETENLINSFELLNLNIHNHLKSYKIEHINSYSNEKSCSDEEQSKGGLILYTSGTTGLPKGVYHNNSNLNHMISSLVIAWEYNQTDKLLHFLPLHHLHGVLNKLLCMLYAGGTIQFCSNANAVNIFKLLAMNGKEIVQYQQNMSNHTKLSINEPNLTLFMAVPTIYAKMIGEVHNLASIHNLTLDKMRQYLLDRSITDLLQYENPNTSVSETNKKSKSALTLLDLKYALFSISRMRLMVSGSAALPDNILDQWLTLTGQTLLERYGMTEIGMALSNPLKGVRRTGYVGMPLPYVKCKIVNDNEQTVTEVDTPGELRVKVHLSYCYIYRYIPT